VPEQLGMGLSKDHPPMRVVVVLLLESDIDRSIAGRQV
jgi:hypothetical protein